MPVINVKGAIVSNDDQWIYDWLNLDATSPKKVHGEIEKAQGNELEVVINSEGGNVFAGSEIYTALKSYPGNVIVKIVGLAASAASVIAMAGRRVLMSPTAQMMIHNVSSQQSGDYRDMEHMAEVLKNANETIANAYMLKTGLNRDEFLRLMDLTTWFTPEQALKYGLIDGILFKDPKPSSSYRTAISGHETKTKAQAQLDLLKLKIRKI